MIPSPSPSVKIQIMGGKVCLRCKSKTFLGVVNKLLITKCLLKTSNNLLPLPFKQSFLPIIWIFTEVEGDGIKSRLPFNFFFYFTTYLEPVDMSSSIDKSSSWLSEPPVAPFLTFKVFGIGSCRISLATLSSTEDLES